MECREESPAGSWAASCRPRHRLPRHRLRPPRLPARPCGSADRSPPRPSSTASSRSIPDMAAFAQLSGMVILEAVVGTDGCVESVKILRSRHLLLDKASEEALLQWRYSPLVLNGIPTSFVLTVTFNFSVQK